jgi:hypothetical protein
MSVARHNSQVPGISFAAARDSAAGWATEEQFRTALEVIRVAATNLRHYHARLTLEDYTAIVNDIEQAAESLSHSLEAMLRPPDVNAEKRRRL